MKIVSLVERGGIVRSFHVSDIKSTTIGEILTTQLANETKLMTDESSIYTKVGREFASHEVVNHSHKEYVRGESHTNTIEGCFSLLKRGLIGTYHKCGEQHLKRYAVEFNFRYNHRAKLGYDDVDRTREALKGIAGKRLTYRSPL
jgi:hypothetical protein